MMPFSHNLTCFDSNIFFLWQYIEKPKINPVSYIFLCLIKVMKTFSYTLIRLMMRIYLNTNVVRVCNKKDEHPLLYYSRILIVKTWIPRFQLNLWIESAILYKDIPTVPSIVDDLFKLMIIQLQRPTPYLYII